jgi:hypothetical protein
MTRRLALAIASTLLILFVCWLPRSYTPDEEDAGGLFGLPNMDKVIHFGIFAVSATLWMRALPRPGRGTRVVVGGLALAVVSELGQAVPMLGRDPGIADALADAAGVGAAAGLIAYLDRPERRRARRPKAEPADGAA